MKLSLSSSSPLSTRIESLKPRGMCLSRNLVVVSLLCLLGCRDVTVAAVKLDDWAYPFLDKTDTPTTTLRRRLQGDNFQSSPDVSGPSYVSSISYNKQSKAVHLVGSTYGAAWDGKWTGGTSGCFYAVLTVANASPVLAHSSMLGVPGVTQACHGVLVDENKSRVYVVGHNTPGGLLETYEDSGFYSDSSIYGNFLDLKYDNIASPTEIPKLAGGFVFETQKAEYTVAVAKEAGESEIFTVNMGLGTLQDNQPGQMVDPTLAESFEYSGEYVMMVAAHSLQDLGDPTSFPAKTLSPEWGEEFVPTSSPLIDIAGVVKIGNDLFVAGTTGGWGKGFGRRNITDPDQDGFVSKFSALDGNIVDPSESLMNSATDPFTWRAFSYRLATDRVHGLCVSELTPEYVYAVGMTEGFLGDLTNDPYARKKAFLAKIRIQDMSLVWSQHILSADTNTEVEGISCTLSGDGSVIYFAGNVRNGVVDLSIDESYGGSDIFVATIDNTLDSSTSDQVIGVRQFGSAADDTLAHRGGLETIDGDSVIIVGNTKGAFARDKDASEQGYSTVFAVVMSKDGDFTMPSGTGGGSVPATTPVPPSAGVPTPDVTPVPPEEPPVTFPTAAPTPQDLFPVVPPPQESADAESSGGGSWEALMILLVLGIVLTGVAMCGQQYWYSKREAATDRKKVLDYLQNFDVEDIDLKHSATGGWHCSYVNDLARGINAQSNYSPSYIDRGFMADTDYHDATFDPLNSAASSPSSPESKVLEDSLFVIDDGEEMLTFGNDRAERGGLGRQYSNKWKMGKNKSGSRRKSNEWGREII